MPIRPSNRASLIAATSFVFALGAAVGPAPREAFAQTTSPAKGQTQGKDKQPKEKPAGDAASSGGDSTTAEAKPKTEEHKEEHKEELDTSVESKKAIYISGEIGATRADLGGLSDKTGFDRTTANGLLYGFSGGVRLKDLRLGLRWRNYDTTDFQLWSFAFSAGYGLPLRPVSPIFSAHVGYVFDQHVEEALYRKALPPESLIPPNVEMRGLLAGIDVNASYWVTQFFRLGIFLGADVMFLSREKAPLPQSIVALPSEISSHPLYTGSGSSIGLNFNAGLRGAFDIAFK